MGELRDLGDIQLNEDIAFLRREWRAQRIGWLVMGVIVALGLVGLFGNGPISSAEIGSRDGFGVAYERIIRHGAQTDLEFHIAPGLQSDSTLRIYISHDYLRRFRVETIVPEPVRSGSAGTLVFYDFERPNARQSSRVIFSLTPLGHWSHSATVALPGAAPVRFSQFALP